MIRARRTAKACLLLLALALALALTACSDKTTNATGHTTAAENLTGTSAALEASAECPGTDCSYYFRWGPRGHPLALTTPAGRSPHNGRRLDETISASVRGLTPGTRYDYRLCSNRGGSTVCFGPGGKTGTPQTLTTPYWTAPVADNALTTSTWYVVPSRPSPLGHTSGNAAGGAALTDCAARSAPPVTNPPTPGRCNRGTSFGYSGADNELSAIYRQCADAYAGAEPGCTPNHGREQNSWYRFEVRFPSGYRPTPGSWNWFFEFHDDSTTAADAAAHHQGGYSFALGVASVYNGACSGSPAIYCIRPGIGPRLLVRIEGGPTASPIQNQYQPFAPDSLKLAHWYDMVLHIYWSADPRKGHVQWWVDGTKALDVREPTLYRRSDGSLSYCTDVGFYNYRPWAAWSDSIDFGRLAVGPTAGSVAAAAGFPA